MFTTDVHAELIMCLHPEISRQRGDAFAELPLGGEWRLRVMGCELFEDEILLKLQLSNYWADRDVWCNYRFKVLKSISDFTLNQLRALRSLEDWNAENPSGSLTDERRPKLFFVPESDGIGLIQFNMAQGETREGNLFLYLTNVYFEGVDLRGTGISQGGQRMVEKRVKAAPAVHTVAAIPSIPPARNSQRVVY